MSMTVTGTWDGRTETRVEYRIVVAADTCGGVPCWLATVPDLPGCMAQGATVRAALIALGQALADYLSTLPEQE